jgi:hypothetical protein
MNYSTLLSRSVDFDVYKLFLDNNYPDPFTQLVALNLVQMLWDRGETNGLRAAPDAASYPRTPRHTVLLLGAVGDHQVSEFALQVEARTMGAAGHVPYVAPDRGVRRRARLRHHADPELSVAAVRVLPLGHRLAAFPLDNVPPRDGHDPHDDTPRIPAVQALKDEFWHRNGAVTDVCGGARARVRSSDACARGGVGRLMTSRSRARATGVGRAAAFSH